MIDAFNSTSKYLDDLLNIDNIHSQTKQMLLIPKKHLLDLKLSIYNGTASTKIYDIVMILILILLISHSSMVMSIGVPLMMYIYKYLN